MSDNDTWIVQARIDDDGLTLEELCRACAVPPDWVEERVRSGLLAPTLARDASAPATTALLPHWRFDAALQLRVRVMRRVEVDFEAAPELAALVADLQDELRRLRARLGERV